MGLTNQVLVLNRCPDMDVPLPQDLPPVGLSIPVIAGLMARQLADGSVLGLLEEEEIETFVGKIVEVLAKNRF